MITPELMSRLFPTKGLDPRKYNLVRHRAALIDQMNRILPKYGINNYLRICAFLGNCGIETDYFRTTIEYASGEDYEGRLGLGNTEPGDGRRFKGRGLTQTTGRSNYKAVQKAIGRKLGIDVVLNPAKLAEIDIAVESACIFWKDNNLNAYADKGLFKQLSAIVNRGDKDKTPLHWAKRNELYSLCKRRVPTDFGFNFTQVTQANSNVTNHAQSKISEPQRGDTDVAPLNEPIVLAPTGKPVVLTPSKPIDSPSEGELANDETTFLADALDKNVSSDELKTVARSAAPKILLKFSRPFLLLYGALEAGNIAAWLGTTCGVLVILYLIYAHREDLKKVWLTIKNKFLA